MEKIFSIIYILFMVPVFSSCQKLPDAVPEDFKLQLYHGGGMRSQNYTYTWTKHAFNYESKARNESELSFELTTDEAKTVLELLKKLRFSSIEVEKAKSLKHDYPSSSITLRMPSLNYNKRVAVGGSTQISKRYKENFSELYQTLTNMAEKHLQNERKSITIIWSKEIADIIQTISFNKTTWLLSKDSLAHKLNVIPGQYTINLIAHPEPGKSTPNIINLPIDIKPEHKTVSLYSDKQNVIKASVE